MNPYQHCRISVRHVGGVASDYYPIHAFIDSTKTLCADGRHRVLHTHWGVEYVVLPIFGDGIENSDGVRVDVKDLCERDHLLPDYGNRFIPTLGDFISAIRIDDKRRLRHDIERFHETFCTDPRVSELMLSPLTTTGMFESLLVTHNSWFINAVLPRIFGTRVLLEDFEIGPARMFDAMTFHAWMDNGIESAPSARPLDRLRATPPLRAVE